MNYKKLFVILMIPIAVNLFIGCCDCMESIFFDYTNCSISVENLDNSGPELLVSSANSISKEAFGLRVGIKTKQDLCQKYSEPLFMNSAYAFRCDCLPPEVYHPLDSIASVKIITLLNFDSSHFSNDDVSEYFSILNSTEFVPMGDYINTQPYEYYDLEDSNLSLDLLLMTPPTENSEHQFEVQVELTDGRVLRETSELVDLL